MRKLGDLFKGKPDKDESKMPRITVKGSGPAIAKGPGSVANSGVRMSTHSDKVEINGKIYRKGDKLPPGVEITWK